MSFDAIRWAFEQTPKKSSEKFVLIALANRANSSGELWASIAQICEDTRLNRKTVIAAIKDLCAQNLIEDTGSRKGSTGQVKVYKLAIYMAENSAKNGTVKQYRKRNSTENGTVPKTDIKSPKNGTHTPLKEYQKRDTEPVSNLTSKEPVNIYTAHDGKTTLDFYNWPNKPGEQIFKDWKAARKLKKQTLSQTVINSFGNEITKAAAKGFTVDQCLTEVITRGWQGFKADWLADKVKPLKNKFTGFDQTDYQAEAKAAGFATELRL